MSQPNMQQLVAAVLAALPSNVAKAPKAQSDGAGAVAIVSIGAAPYPGYKLVHYTVDGRPGRKPKALRAAFITALQAFKG